MARRSFRSIRHSCNAGLVNADVPLKDPPQVDRSRQQLDQRPLHAPRSARAAEGLPSISSTSLAPGNRENAVESMKRLRPSPVKDNPTPDAHALSDAAKTRAVLTGWIEEDAFARLLILVRVLANLSKRALVVHAVSARCHP